MSEPTTIALAPRVNQQTIASLVATLKAHQGQPVQIDASAVKHIGAPGFEALLAAARSWRAATAGFAVIEPSAAFLSGVGHIGLAESDFGISEG